MTRKLIALALCGAMLLPMGCATHPETYELPAKPASSYALSQTQDGLTVAVEPIVDKDLQKKIFGMELSSLKALPFLVVAENRNGEAGFRLDETGVSLLRKGQAAAKGESDPTVPNRSLPIGHKAVVAVWYTMIAAVPFAPVTLVPGIIAGSIAETEEKKVEFTNQMLVEGAFRSRTLFPGETHRGFVYFQAKDASGLKEVSALSLKATNMATGEETAFTIDLAKALGGLKP